MNEQNLTKKYGLPTATALAVGIVIGSGIFFKAEKILNITGGDLKTGILAWIIGGIIAVVSACAFAVMATRYQNMGGVVDYAEATVGSDYAYYLGWMMTLIYYPTLTSCLAWLSARYTCILLGFDILGGECMTLTLLFLVLVYFVSAVAPRVAGKLQVSLTIIKLIPILLMGFVGTIVGLQNGMTVENFTTVTTNIATENPLFAAVTATAFAFEGWVIATSINGELHNAKRNLPIALIGGVSAVAVIYLVYYIGIAGAIPNAVMMESGQEGARLAYSAIFGEMAGTLLFVFVVLSCLGTCNGLMMGCTRGMHAVAIRGRGPAPKLFSQVDPISGMSHNSAAIGVVFAALWVVFFFFGSMKQMLGPFKFDSSEVPIISMYAMYIPIYLGFMKKATDESVARRFIIPALAICGSIFMVVSAVVSYRMDVFYYLIVLAFVYFLGFIWSKEKKL